MFGMLDYRAHKLYLITVAPIKWICNIAYCFLPPVTCVLAAKLTAALSNTTTNDNWGIILLIIIYYFFGWMFFMMILMLPLIVFEKIFFFFIDVVPTNNHNEEDALQVVREGKKAIIRLKIEKTSPILWQEDIMRQYANQGLLSKYLSGKIYNRLHCIKEHYLQNNLTGVIDLRDQQLIEQILKQYKLELTFIEKFFPIIFFPIIWLTIQLLTIIASYKLLIN